MQIQKGKWAGRAVVALACLAGACGGGSGSAASSPDVWATVDGREIRRAEIEKIYQGTLQPNAAPLSEEEAFTMKMNVLDDFINQDIIVARARTLKLEASDTDVNTALAEQKRGVSDEDFVKQLAQRGLTEDDFKRGLRRDLTAQKLVQQEVTSKINITDDEVAAFYNANKAQFNVAEPQFRVAQIIITPTRDPSLRNRTNNDAATPAEAKAKYEMVMAKLRSAADFAAMAADYSEDPQTVASGGDLGYVPMSALKQASPQLRELITKTEPGKMSSVIVGDTYQIVMVISREPAGQRELTTPTVRDSIRDILSSRREQLLRMAYITAARSDAKVVNYLARTVVAQQAKMTVPAPATPAK